MTQVERSHSKPEAEESNRMWASASFVGVLIIIGLPLWWKTTEVYRVSLPYEQINAFDPESHYLTSDVVVVAVEEMMARDVVEHIEDAFKSSSVIRLRVQKRVLPPDLVASLELLSDERQVVDRLGEMVDLTTTNMVLVVQWRSLDHEAWLGDERVVLFKDRKSIPTLTQVLSWWVFERAVLAGARAAGGDGARRTRLPPAPAYHLALTVVHPAPHEMDVRFDAQAAVEDYIGSFVDELSELHNFTLMSQWLHLLDFDFQAQEVKDSSARGRHYAVRAARLPQLLTRLEERAPPPAAPAPALRLALYVVPCRLAPLKIYDDEGNVVSGSVQAFMSPQWGGMVLSSPSEAECGAAAGGAPTHEPDARLIMGTFLAQLRPLLGITDKPPIEGAVLSPLRAPAPRRWELDSLLRIRTLEQLASAERSLLSLARLLGEIPNIVITEEVGARVGAAAAGCARGAALGAAGRLLEAQREGRSAHRAAEAAFVDPSLLALLYFPDDQKYAIYIPLFLPIMVPVLLSLKNLVQWLRGRPLHADKEKND